jgi:NhaP-type Na+/H+ or K+/H+ antiporter
MGFALAIAVVGGAGLLAVLSNRLSQRLRVPAAAIFLLAAAVASDLVPALGRVPVVTVQRVVTVALIVLLFDGGMHIGWRRFRSAAAPVAWIGVVGTFATTAGIAVLAHLLFGFEWLPALLLGTALAPTDPAVVFSVLGRREISGRTGTLLEGESGANDPVGIAAMASLLAVGTASGWHAVGSGLAEFTLEMVVGAAAGLAGGYALALFMRRVPLPSGALYPLSTLAAAAVIYGTATLAHGSGFLAVFIAGILVGDLRATTWIWEGVVPYLSRAEVAATVQAVSDRSAAGGRLIVNDQSPALSAVLGRLAARAMTAMARRRSPWVDEPRRSSWTPTAMSELLAGYGFHVSRDDDLLTLAENLPVPIHQRRSLQIGRVAVAER